MKCLLYSLVFLLSSFHLQSQDIRQSLIGPGGTETAVTATRLDWSLGQIVNTTVKTKDGLLTQGYLQPIISLDKPDNFIPTNSATLSLYPNPALANLTVTISFDSNQRVSMSMFNIYGSPCLTIPDILSGSKKELDLRPYPSGTYFIMLYDTSGRLINKTHFIKI